MGKRGVGSAGQMLPKVAVLSDGPVPFQNYQPYF